MIKAAHRNTCWLLFFHCWKRASVFILKLFASRSRRACSSSSLLPILLIRCVFLINLSLLAAPPHPICLHSVSQREIQGPSQPDKAANFINYEPICYSLCSDGEMWGCRELASGPLWHPRNKGIERTDRRRKDDGNLEKRAPCTYNNLDSNQQQVTYYWLHIQCLWDDFYDRFLWDAIPVQLHINEVKSSSTQTITLLCWCKTVHIFSQRCLR